MGVGPVLPIMSANNWVLTQFTLWDVLCLVNVYILEIFIETVFSTSSTDIFSHLMRKQDIYGVAFNYVIIFINN